MSSGAKDNIRCTSDYLKLTEQQIIEAFRVFDEEEKGTIPIKYVETIVRALGRVPRKKADIRSFIKEVRDPESKDMVKLETFLPAMTDILIKDRWKPVPKEILLEAFEYLDIGGEGILRPEYMRKLLTKHGDKLDEEEIKKFLTFAISDGKIHYKECYEKMAVPEVVDILEDKKKLLAELKDETSYKITN